MKRNDVARAVLFGTARSSGCLGEPGHPAPRLLQARASRLRAARTRILLTTALTTALAGLVPHQAKAATCSPNITASCTVTQSQSLGSLTNTGSIGALSNAGTISGSSTGVLNQGSIGTLSNSGTIYNPSFAGTGTQASGYAIVNSGEIQDFNNIGTILGGGTAFLNNGSVGTLSNSGTIAGGYSNGIYNDLATSSIGTLTNTGVLAGWTGGVDNQGTIGTLTNSGTITSPDDSGIYNRGTINSLTNDSAGVIFGTTYGIDNGGSIGTLTNSGTISGGYTGIYNRSGGESGGAGSIGTLTNTGVISGRSGIDNQGSIGVLTNSGTISGGRYTGVYNDYGSIGTLTNSGTISGGYRGIENYYGTIGTLANSGTISGASDSGVYNNGSIGALTNSGVITGALEALYIGAGGSIGLLTDSGTIAGNIDNESSQALTINGGSGTTFGTLTGYNGATGSITSTAANVVFGSGNLLLNDNINVGSNSVTDTGATLLVDGLSSITSSSPLEIAGGLLEVGDAAHSGAVLISAVAVGSAGELRGHGTIVGNVTNAGVVYPGGSVGILTVNGNYVQSSSGTFEVEVGPATTAGTGYDQLAVTGSASLAGALAVNVDGNVVVGYQYDILTAAGGVSGTFSKASYSAAFGAALAQYLTPTVNYTANDVYLELVPTTTGGLSTAPIFSTGRIYAASAYAQNNALQSVLGAPLGMDSSDTQVDQGYWLHGIGNFGSANGYDFNAKGFVVGKGFDVSPNLVIGGAVSNVYTSTSGGGSSVDGTSFGGLVYGLYNAGRLSLSASAGVGHMSDNINRYLPGLGWQAKSASNGAYEGADAQLQYSLLPGNSPYFLAPYARVSYLHTGLGSAQETNAGILNLRYDALNTNLAQLGAGLTGGYSMPVKYGMLTAWASLGGLGTLGNPHAAVTERLGTYTARETALAAPVAALTPGVGLELKGNSPWRLAAGWGGQFGSATSAENLTLQASYKW